MEVGLFFMPKNARNLSGGGSCAHKNNIGMHRVSAEKLQHDKRQKSSS